MKKLILAMIVMVVIAAISGCVDTSDIERQTPSDVTQDTLKINYPLTAFFVLSEGRDVLHVTITLYGDGTFISEDIEEQEVHFGTWKILDKTQSKYTYNIVPDGFDDAMLILYIDKTAMFQQDGKTEIGTWN